jgi:hypothetical protein
LPLARNNLFFFQIWCGLGGKTFLQQKAHVVKRSKCLERLFVQGHFYKNVFG